MAQPVIDTLQVADALQRSGMEREQAEGVARTLGTELGDHVAVRKDLDLGFERVLAHVDERFARVDERFARIDERFKALDGKLNLMLVGAGLALAYLAVIASLDRFV